MWPSVRHQSFSVLRPFGDDFDAFKAKVQGFHLSDADTRTRMAQIHKDSGYVCDPHGAIGNLAATETDILQAYDKYLQQRSSVHFGYPYNLMYDHQELFNFMKYSINNLGDPYVVSNYSVHSRQFECAVIDFFADLWKADEDSRGATWHRPGE